jgi:predicted transcriptional regulator
MTSTRVFTRSRATLKYVSETQNLTLSLPKELVRRVKVVAAERGTSITAMVTRALEDVVEDRAYYREITRRLLEHANSRDWGIHLPDREHRWTRDELHER